MDHLDEFIRDWWREYKRRTELDRLDHERLRALIEDAVAYCMDAIDRGAIESAKDRATDYISEQTWKRLSRNWQQRNCVALAELAQAVLDGRDVLRKGVSRLLTPVFDRLEEWLAKSHALRRVFELPVLRMVRQVLAARLARVIAQEVLERISRRLTLVDQRLTAAARAIQMTGIIFCFMQDRDLRTCACFVAIVEKEGKEMVKRLLLIAADNWVELGQLQPDDLATA